MPRQPASTTASELTKGQLRKLNALKKSVGVEIGERAFAEWLAAEKVPVAPPIDETAAIIAAAIEDLIANRQLTIPKTGYLLKRGRGRVIVTRPATD